MKPPWRFHLSTLPLLMLWAGCMLYLNLQPHSAYRSNDGPVYGFPADCYQVFGYETNAGAFFERYWDRTGVVKNVATSILGAAVVYILNEGRLRTRRPGSSSMENAAGH